MSHSLGKAFRPRNVAKTYAAIAKRHARILQIVATQLTILERWIEEKSSLTLEIDPTYVLRIKCYRCVETVPKVHPMEEGVCGLCVVQLRSMVMEC